MTEIRGGTVLPAKRTPVTVPTADGLRLVGELALPADAEPVATLICLHPLPTRGGMMDSHVLKKASFSLLPWPAWPCSAKHLWVGEPYLRIVLTEIVRRVNPVALVPPAMTLPTEWEES